MGAPILCTSATTGHYVTLRAFMPSADVARAVEALLRLLGCGIMWPTLAVGRFVSQSTERTSL
jgi:hypothetical protein